MDSFTDIKKILVGTPETGSIINKVSDSIKDYLPISMTEKEKGDMNLSIANAIMKESCLILEVAHKNELEDNLQAKMLDGTANDLLQAGKLGKLALLWRGSQRSFWNVAILIFTFFWFFTDKIKLNYLQIPDPTNPGQVLYQADPITQTKLMVLIIIYSLSMGALFGERAFRNIIPLITSILSMFTGRKPVMKVTPSVKGVDLTPKG